MATYNQALPVNQTLTGTTADVVNITAGALVGRYVRVVNRDAVNTLWVKGAGTAPVAADQTVVPVLPSQALNFYIGDQIVDTSTVAKVQVVGNGGGYHIGNTSTS